MSQWILVLELLCTQFLYGYKFFFLNIKYPLNLSYRTQCLGLGVIKIYIIKTFVYGIIFYSKSTQNKATNMRKYTAKSIILGRKIQKKVLRKPGRTG